MVARIGRGKGRGMSNRKYMTKDELAVLLEEQHSAEIRMWDVDAAGEFLGFWYDGDVIRIPSPEECGRCGGTGEVCYSSTNYGPCTECSTKK